jgi:hypothetical protein
MGRPKVNYFQWFFLIGPSKLVRPLELGNFPTPARPAHSRALKAFTHSRILPAQATATSRQPLPPLADHTPPRRRLLRLATPPPVTAAARPGLRCPARPPPTAALLSLYRPTPDWPQRRRPSLDPASDSLGPPLLGPALDYPGPRSTGLGLPRRCWPPPSPARLGLLDATGPSCPDTTAPC